MPQLEAEPTKEQLIAKIKNKDSRDNPFELVDDVKKLIELGYGESLFERSQLALIGRDENVQSRWKGVVQSLETWLPEGLEAEENRVAHLRSFYRVGLAFRFDRVENLSGILERLSKYVATEPPKTITLTRPAGGLLIKSAHSQAKTSATQEPSAESREKSAKPKIEMGYCSLAKLGSPHNEDAVYLNTWLGLAALFDGEDDPNIASLARDSLVDILQNARRNPDFFKNFKKNPDMNPVLAAINKDLLSKELPGKTSVTIATLIDYNPEKRLYSYSVGNIGKTRCYVFRTSEDYLKKESQENALNMVDENDIPLPQYEQSYYKHRRYTIQQLNENFAITDRNKFITIAQQGDLLLLLSEGVYLNLNRIQIEEVTRDGLKEGWSSEQITATLTLKAHRVAEIGKEKRGELADATAIALKLK